MNTRTDRPAKDIQKKVERSAYEAPKVVTYTNEQIVEKIGPAQACSPTPSCTVTP